MSTPKEGSLVEIVFDDHAEGYELLRFRAYGRLYKKDSKKYIIQTWHYDQNQDTLDDNVESFTLSRKSVISITELTRS